MIVLQVKIVTGITNTMMINKNFLLYLLYRGLSAFFFVVSVYTFMLEDDFSWMLEGVYIFAALFFLFQYSSLPTPKQTQCLDSLHAIVASLITTFFMISYGIFTLSLYITLRWQTLPSEMLPFASLFFVSMIVLYISLCKRVQ